MVLSPEDERKMSSFCQWYNHVCWGEGNRVKIDGTDHGLRMDLIPSPAALFHPALPDTDINSSPLGAWHCAHHNKKIRGERGAMSKRGKKPTPHPEDWDTKWPRVEFNKSLHTLPTPCYCFYICLSRSKSFIPQILLCVADGWMDRRLHSSCLLCLHFCLGKKLFLYACVCPSQIKNMCVRA